MDTFQEVMREKQFFIRQPNICVLVFAKNAKKGSYCGFFNSISETNPFDQKEFLVAHALASPRSKIRCVLQP